MFRRHPFKWLFVVAIAGLCLWLRFRTVPMLPGDHLKSGLEALAAGNFSSAERHFRDELLLVPNQPVACEQLALLLIRSGRSWEALPCVRTALKQQNLPQNNLARFSGDPGEWIDENLLKDWHRESPEDPAPLPGLARIALRSGRIEDARQLLAKVLSESPQDLEAHVVKGQVELATNRSQLPEWNSTLPKAAESHPEIWFVRGDWCQLSGDPEMARRCFLEGIRLNPNDRNLNLRLGQLLGQEDCQPFLARAESLLRVSNAIYDMYSHSNSARALEVAESLFSIGRYREAAKWGQIAMISDQRLMWQMTTDLEFADKYRRITAGAEKENVWHEGSKIDVQSFPAWQPPATASASGGIKLNRKIRFRNDATEVGLDFTYFNGDDPDTEGQRMQEYPGGGPGVLDVDHDGWPDLYFSQGCTWPPGTDVRFEDQLYRNLRGHSFFNATAAAGFGDTGFGQGVAVADFNNDGFDDLFLCNIGPNRLYLGNGDGTFSEIVTPQNVAGDEWSCSCAPGDFNGDGLTDLYVSNYLRGYGVFEMICENQNVKVTCAPSNFETAEDCLLINLGDGQFENQSVDSGIQVPDGAGLGVVTAHFNSDNRLDVFVANDQKPNFCFMNESPPDGPKVFFREQAVNIGLAFDRDGKAQACMGVAVGHLNGDEFPDLLVTNFSNESNTLYLSQPSGIYSDATLASGLARPSYAMLGFGTAFLDADLDGRLDLVVANGHIGDHRAFGDLYRMRPQFFCHTGTNDMPEFSELPPSDAGSYFETELLGRGLAVLDWNRDGRPDFCVSHLDTPVSLLTNETAEPGTFLALRLCGVQSCRDAVGTRLRLLVDGQPRFFELAGGASYASSSERVILIGTGAATRVEEMRILWPSGEIQSFHNLETNQSLVAIEGRSMLISDNLR